VWYNGIVEWMKYANCRGYTKTMYPTNDKVQAAAKRLCASCGVRSECLEYALSNFEEHGIWGGLNSAERARLSVNRLLVKRSNSEQQSNTHEQRHLASVSLSSPESTSYSQTHMPEVLQTPVVFRVVFR